MLLADCQGKLLPYAELRSGERVAGTLRRSVELASGKYTVIEKSREFTLVCHGGLCLSGRLWCPEFMREEGFMDHWAAKERPERFVA
ncbi:MULTISPECIES: DUF3363 domain-containing protein [Mesorhizobium]|uniref:Uncharacterized protein n=1 Tax=Mesorhizobium muleiense TaxID=1004279 RepID=A0A1G9F4X6_9HYPH|nr:MULTISPECIES: DUF3363 domain-containing protein [Mesorhizobium]SDK83437.1 Protein of unknown function [Mesorhizobium muleiense]